MVAILERVTDKHHRLSMARPLPDESLRSLRDDFLVRYSHETTALEGNSLSLCETQVVLENGIAIGGKLLAEHLEVLNVRDALIWLEDFVSSSEPVSDDTILHLHSIILRGLLGLQAGAYRRQAVRIVGSTHVPPNWVRVPDAMAAFVEGLHEDGEHPVVFAARAHLELARIHPSVDGNGRVSRMLVNLVLERAGYLPALYSADDRNEYLDALERAYSYGDEVPFIALTARAIEVVLDQHLDLLAMTSETE